MALIKLNNNLISAVSALPSGIDTGKVGQVVSTTKTDTATISSSGFADVSGLTLNITPSATSSKVLIKCNITLNHNDSNHTVVFRFLRDSTAVGVGASAGSRTSALMRFNMATSGDGYYSLVYSTGDVSTNFLDSPSSTDEQVYKIQGIVNGANSLHINRTGSDSDGANYSRTNSTITVMEILA